MMLDGQYVGLSRGYGTSTRPYISACKTHAGLIMSAPKLAVNSFVTTASNHHPDLLCLELSLAFVVVAATKVDGFGNHPLFS